MPSRVTLIGGRREGGPGGQTFQVPQNQDLSPIYGVVRVTANYRVGADARFVLVDATNGAVSVTLPAAPQSLPVTVKKIDSTANHVIIRVSGPGVIDGATTATLTGQYDSVFLVPSGNDWWKG